MTITVNDSSSIFQSKRVEIANTSKRILWNLKDATPLKETVEITI